MPDDRATTVAGPEARTPVEDAQRTIRLLFWGGIALVIAGSIIASIAHPHTVTSRSYAADHGALFSHRGSAAVETLGLAIGAIGLLALVAGLVAWAVRLGIIASRG
jgi:ABC-type Fe3+ transport system permease subunit